MFAISTGVRMWAVGVALWIRGFALYRVAPWWAGLVVVTIVGERLELSRLTGATERARWSFAASLALFVVGLVLSVPSFDLGMRVAGAGLTALALWLAGVVLDEPLSFHSEHEPPFPFVQCATESSHAE